MRASTVVNPRRGGSAHGTLQRLGILPVALAELAVLQRALGQMIGLIFLPQQHERHALARELPVDCRVVGNDRFVDLAEVGKQAPLKRRLIERFDIGPAQAGGFGGNSVLAHHALGNA